MQGHACKNHPRRRQIVPKSPAALGQGRIDTKSGLEGFFSGDITTTRKAKGTFLLSGKTSHALSSFESLSYKRSCSYRSPLQVRRQLVPLITWEERGKRHQGMEDMVSPWKWAALTASSPAKQVSKQSPKSQGFQACLVGWFLTASLGFA